MILKSVITVIKENSLNDTSPNCHLIVKGIAPPLQVDLCTDSNDNLTILGTIETASSNMSTGPVKVSTGMCIYNYVATYVHVLYYHAMIIHK